MLDMLIMFLIVGLIIGLVLWLVTAFTPIDARIKQVLSAVVVVLFIIWILLVLAGHSPVHHFR